jgi:membrane-bound ClpP family serine protease
MLTAIILFIVLGVFLMLLEILVIPGTTVAAFGSVILLGLGIYFSYSNYGVQMGNYVLGGTILFLLVALIFSLRARTWKRFMLNSSIDGQVNTIETDIKVGDTGMTVARLNPMGKVMVGEEYYEARAINEIIDPNTEIIVTKIIGNTLVVKSKNK